MVIIILISNHHNNTAIQITVHTSVHVFLRSLIASNQRIHLLGGYSFES